MKSPLSFFRRAREDSDAARSERQSERERRLTQGLRALSGLLLKLADNLEAQRLARGGYDAQGKFLERSPDKK
jgi:hypothetical protein